MEINNYRKGVGKEKGGDCFPWGHVRQDTISNSWGEGVCKRIGGLIPPKRNKGQ